MIFIDEERCTGCGLCLDACAQGAIALGESGATIDQNLCARCAACVVACPQAAIYEAEAAPVPMVAVSAEAQPTQGALARWQPTLIRVRPAIASTLAAAGPLALDVLSGLARTWLDQRGATRRADGWPEPGRGGGCRRRRRGGHRC
jgi:Fe-S-cluster-containing hydrogenase component 2